jgi:chromosome segregation ATPase
VQKVIELLEENKVKIANDLAAEEKEMGEYAEFCDKESSDKGYAIETATSKIADLSALIEKCTTKIPAYEDEIATLGSDVAAKNKQVYEATELRKKEQAEFKASEAELVTAVDQLDRAVTIIKREMPSFAQLPAGSKNKKSVEVAVKVLSKIIDSEAISIGTRRQLNALLQTGNMQSEDFSFRHGQPQATQVAYESKSGGIVEKIEEMKEKAEETLTQARSAEMKAAQDFDMLEQSLNNGITVGNDKISTAKSALGLTTEELNKAKGDLGETEASKAADEKALAELKHDCETAAADWATRQESASAEMGAINKAIEVLSEGVRVLLQTGAKLKDVDADEADSPGGTQSLARQQLVSKLKDMSKKFGSYALMEMAGSATSDPFVKIRGLIEDMIAKLLKEAQEEATQKAFCDEEMGKSTASKKEKTMTLDKLNSRIDKASARTAELGEAIKTLESEVATLDASVAEATKLRTEEAASNAKAIKDFGDAAAATEKAIKILKDFYDNAALIQTSSKTTSKAEQPELGSSKSGAGGVIIGILEMSNEDFVKLHSETSTAEAEAQEAYEKLMNDSKASKAAKLAEVKASQSEVKSLKVSLENYGEDKGMTSSELDAVLDYIEKLKPQCEEKAMSYAEKKARREAEIAGLKEALEILAGEALVQTGRHLRRVSAH